MELDRIAVGILHQDLLAARPYLDVVQKSSRCCLEGGYHGVEVLHVENDSVRPAWLLLSTIRQRPRTRGAGPAQQQAKIPARNDGHRSGSLHEAEGQMLGVIGDRTLDIPNLIADYRSVRVCRKNLRRLPALRICHRRTSVLTTLC